MSSKNLNLAKFNLFKIVVSTTAFSVATVLAISEAYAASFDSISQIYAYGDSYSDNGLSFDISTAAVKANVPGSFILPADPTLSGVFVALKGLLRT